MFQRRVEGLVYLIGMRGDERVQDGMFSYVLLEQRVPADHPLRGIRKLTDVVLASVDAELDKLYKDSGVYITRPSVAGVLFRALGAVAGRADRLQPALPLVCGPWHRRCAMESRGVF